MEHREVYMLVVVVGGQNSGLLVVARSDRCQVEAVDL